MLNLCSRLLFPSLPFLELPSPICLLALECWKVAFWSWGDPGASGSVIFALFNDNNYYILGLHAGGAPLEQAVRLPNGVATDIVNRGVQVSQWSTQAMATRGAN